MKQKESYLSETDENLLFLFSKCKEKLAIEVLFDRYMASAYYLAFKYMHNQADAEDVVQKAFFNIMRFAGDQNKPGVVKAWIMKTVINTSLNELKHIERHRKKIQSQILPQEMVSPEETTDALELRGKLIKAVEQLPEHFKMPIWLAHYENMSIKEVSDCLGKPEKTIRTQIARGIEKLRDILKINGSEINAATVIAILAFCKSNDKVPLTLYEKINKLSTMKLSSKMMIQPFSEKTSFGYFYFSLISVIVFSFIGFASFQYLTKRINSNAIIEIDKNALKASNVDTLNLSCDFSSEKLPAWLSIELGKGRISSGEKNNRILVAESPEDFFLKLNIPHQNKPYKVSYDLKITSVPKYIPFLFALSKDNLDVVTFLFDNSIWENSWVHIEFIVQDKIEAMWINKSLRIVYANKNSYNTAIGIRMTGATFSFDNIHVRSLAEKEIINFSSCVKLGEEYRSIPGENTREINSPLPNYKKGKITAYWGKIE